MKAMLVCALAALSVFQLVAADGTYTYNGGDSGGATDGNYGYGGSSDQTTGVQQASAASAKMCVDLVAKWGVQGCTSALNTYLQQDGSARLLCIDQIKVYLDGLVNALVTANAVVVVQAGATLSAQASATVTAQAGASVQLAASIQGAVQGQITASQSAVFDLAFKGCAGVTGGVIGKAIGGLSVSAIVDINLVGSIDVAVKLHARVRASLSCTTTKCVSPSA